MSGELACARPLKDRNTVPSVGPTISLPHWGKHRLVGKGAAVARRHHVDNVIYPWTHLQGTHTVSITWRTMEMLKLYYVALLSWTTKERTAAARSFLPPGAPATLLQWHLTRPFPLALRPPPAPTASCFPTPGRWRRTQLACSPTYRQVGHGGIGLVAGFHSTLSLSSYCPRVQVRLDSVCGGCRTHSCPSMILNRVMRAIPSIVAAQGLAGAMHLHSFPPPGHAPHLP